MHVSTAFLRVIFFSTYTYAASACSVATGALNAYARGVRRYIHRYGCRQVGLRVFWVCIVGSMYGALAVWEGCPAYAEVVDDLRETQRDLQQTQAKEKKLRQKLKRTKSRVAEVQSQLTQLGPRILQQETRLRALEDKHVALSKEYTLKAEELQRARGYITALIDAAIRLQRMPVEMALALPEGTEHPGRTMRMLSVVVRHLRQEMQALETQIRALQALEEQLSRARAQVQEDTQALHRDKRRLEALLKERQTLQVRILGQYTQQHKKAGRLSRKMKTLQELITRLEQERRTVPTPVEKPRQRNAPITTTDRILSHAANVARMPASGTVEHRFGDKKTINERYRGMVIRTRARAPVIAPAVGEVLFAGHFLDYGKMVILRHGKDHHSLLAGLHRIDCVVGQSLLEGEPLGVMGSARDSGTRLYLEVRRQGSPTDPDAWIRK